MKRELTKTLESTSATQTADIAARLANAIQPGTTVGLSGTLGAGKTLFAQSFATACGVAENTVVSPTFVICQQYQTSRFLLYHLDVYRLQSAQEFLDLGVEEWMDDDSVQLIEWADRIRDYLPEQRVDIDLEVTGETSRRVTIRAVGESLVEIIDAL